jgi:hypothetical protein
VHVLEKGSIDPLSRETYVINVHDVMCVEIRKVVVEACNELKKARAKYLFFSRFEHQVI